MHYMFSKIWLVFAIWGVSKDTVFALSSVLLKRQCLRLRQLGMGQCENMALVLLRCLEVVTVPRTSH